MFKYSYPVPFMCSPLTTICFGKRWYRMFTPSDEAYKNAVEHMIAGGVRVV